MSLNVRGFTEFSLARYSQICLVFRTEVQHSLAFAVCPEEQGQFCVRSRIVNSLLYKTMPFSPKAPCWLFTLKINYIHSKYIWVTQSTGPSSEQKKFCRYWKSRATRSKYWRYSADRGKRTVDILGQDPSSGLEKEWDRCQYKKVLPDLLSSSTLSVHLKTLTRNYTLTLVLCGNGTRSWGFTTGCYLTCQGHGQRAQLAFGGPRSHSSGDGQFEGWCPGRRSVCHESWKMYGFLPRVRRSLGTELRKSNATDF
ncbi:uncharacterized protein LOC134350988 [Mobula hypostoma]|uniref:uncharacterized protein LOC134350988 n=1 Tax=Mobula hypostoma TaxID=723540 RepID=UPI002FC3BF84